MDFTHEAIKMAGSLALVIAILLAGLVLMRRMFGEVGGQGSVPLMRILGGLRLGAGKQIMLIEVSGEVLVVGTTAREVTLLTKIVEEDRIAQLRTISSPIMGRLGPWMGLGKLSDSASSDIPKSYPDSPPRTISNCS